MATVPNTDDTIVAIASPPGESVRGIVRLSGPDTLLCVAKDFVADAIEGEPIGSAAELEIAQTKSTCWIDGHLVFDDVKIPGRLMLWPSNQSFTRQPSAEFHTIGSMPVLQMAVKAYCRHGARMAEPGEFTMRAFLSGRIDLTQAEAVLAVIDSQNRAQLSIALEQLAGGLAGSLDELRNQLMSALAELEAGLDFVEEDIEFISNDEMIRQLADAKSSLENLLTQIESRDSGQTLFRVGLFGLPNAGKSSLFNAILGGDHAIVTNLAGTTTDKVTAITRFQDIEIELVDTAGFEGASSPGSISQASQDQREDESNRCDLAVLCIDAIEFLKAGSKGSMLASQAELIPVATPRVTVLTKSDQLDETKYSEVLSTIDSMEDPTLLVSSTSLRGLDALQQEIVDAFLKCQTQESSIVGSTVIRTGECLRESLGAIESALQAASLRLGDEIVASEVRSGLDSLGQIVGKVYTDDILGLVFGRFCIGK